MRGHAQRDRGETGAREFADAGALGQRQHERERAGPERLRQRQRRRIEHALALGGIERGDMRDEGVEGGAALGCIDARDRRRRGRIRAEPIDRLGREGDEAAGAQDVSGAAAALGVIRQTRGGFDGITPQRLILPGVAPLGAEET